MFASGVGLNRRQPVNNMKLTIRLDQVDPACFKDLSTQQCYIYTVLAVSSQGGARIFPHRKLYSNRSDSVNFGDFLYSEFKLVEDRSMFDHDN